MNQLSIPNISIRQIRERPHEVVACFGCQGEAHRLSINLASLVTNDDTNETIRDKIVARCCEQCDRQINRAEYVDTAKRDKLFFSGVGSRVRARIDDINEREIIWQYECDGAWHKARVRFPHKHDYLDYICADGLSELGRAFIKMATRATMKRLRTHVAAPNDLIASFVKTLPVHKETAGQVISNDMSWRLYLSGSQ